MIDRHQPAVGLVEIVAHRMNRRLLRRSEVHPVEVAHPGLADRRALLLDREINADHGISDERQLEADEDRSSDEADADEGRVDAGDPTEGRTDSGDLRVLAI